MQDAFLPIFLFALAGFALAVGLLFVSSLFNPGKPGGVIRMPYESGMDPIHDTRRRFNVRFHLLAIAFLVFDVELLFLYPWAVAVHPGRGEESVVRGPRAVAGASAQIQNPQSPAARSTSRAPQQGIDAAVAAGWVESRHLVFGGTMVFLVLLTLGFVYDWRKGVFQWH